MGSHRRSEASRFSQMGLVACLGRIFPRDDSDSSVVEGTLFACLLGMIYRRVRQEQAWSVCPGVWGNWGTEKKGTCPSWMETGGLVHILIFTQWGKSEGGGRWRRAGVCWGAPVPTGRWRPPVSFCIPYLCCVCFLMVEVYLILATVIINSQKKMEKVDLILQTSFISTDECMRHFQGFHSGFKVSSVFFKGNAQHCFSNPH